MFNILCVVCQLIYSITNIEFSYEKVFNYTYVANTIVFSSILLLIKLESSLFVYLIISFLVSLLGLCFCFYISNIFSLSSYINENLVVNVNYSSSLSGVFINILKLLLLSGLSSNDNFNSLYLNTLIFYGIIIVKNILAFIIVSLLFNKNKWFIEIYNKYKNTNSNENIMLLDSYNCNKEINHLNTIKKQPKKSITNKKYLVHYRLSIKYIKSNFIIVLLMFVNIFNSFIIYPGLLLKFRLL